MYMLQCTVLTDTSHRMRVTVQQPDLGIGWEVGTTDTNLGQFAICSCTFEQDAMWDRILTRVT